MWLGHDLDHQVKVWNWIEECPGLMVNAYQLHNMPLVYAKASQDGLAAHLGYDGPVFMDSGGFLFQQAGNAAISADRLLEMYDELRPDIGAVLDIPLDPLLPQDDNRRRWNATLRNTCKMLERNPGVELAVILHAYSLQAIKQRCEDVSKLIKDPKVLCIGSLVPLLKASHIGSRFHTSDDRLSRVEQRWRLIAKLVGQVRRHFQSSILHVFGVGSMSVMYLLFLLGVDSVDSVSWRLKAGFGAIQLPGLGDRFLRQGCGRSKTRRLLGKHELELLEECQCPVCDGHRLEQRIRRLETSFYNRAAHNAFVLLSETKAVGDAIRTDRLASLVETRLEAHPYNHILDRVIMPAVLCPTPGDSGGDT
jgi:7-cyano-7-deazaguanine tRNA-ribosyltransferase